MKWVLFDFQISIGAKNEKTLQVKENSQNRESVHQNGGMAIKDSASQLHIDTGKAEFFINKNVFKPFDQVHCNGVQLLDSRECATVLLDDGSILHQPVIQSISTETHGALRCTIKLEGRFESTEGRGFANFVSRIHFYKGLSTVKIDFTLHNPNAATHPGGLWDLGDPGSVLFNDLSIQMALQTPNRSQIHWKSQPHASFTSSEAQSLTIYQDSSGGENWRSINHVNRDNEVRNSFRGYRVTEEGQIIEENHRAQPTLCVGDGERSVSGGVGYFWQNFPKALKAEKNRLIMGLFPKAYNDLYELQGGEQKSHTLYFHFNGMSGGAHHALDGIASPLIPVVSPRCLASSRVFPYLIPDEESGEKKVLALMNSAVEGENTFFKRREIIDEYGWRHFGEFYADHEAVGREDDDDKPFISHYNNQYDGIYGTLIRFAASGNPKWFLLADQLCRHVKDIDIYHTDKDRPEYNHGLFWHTEHYIQAETATHRCFSRRHANKRDLSFYGGGPSLSHLYATGLLYHYYMTGEETSKEAVMELAGFVLKNMDMEATITNSCVKTVKRLVKKLSNIGKKEPLVDLNKVYGLDGPGRASGNGLSTLMDAWALTNDARYLDAAESLIVTCISPEDDIEKRDLLDVENRWMYTVFLQAVGKYLDLIHGSKKSRPVFEYARRSLNHYADWMLEHEYPYLEKPEKLEFPNETWAVQDIRKANVFLVAARYAGENQCISYHDKLKNIYAQAIQFLEAYGTWDVTRALVLLMQNAMPYSFFLLVGMENVDCEKRKNGAGIPFSTDNVRQRIPRKEALKNEWEYIWWRLR